MSLTELVKELRDLTDRVETMEEQIKASKARINILKTAAIPEAMEDADIEKVTVEGAGTISLQTKVYSSILKEDRDRFYQWLRENGNADLIVDWVFPGTQNAFIKERIETGQDYPEFCNVSLIPTATLRRN